MKNHGGVQRVCRTLTLSILSLLIVSLQARAAVGRVAGSASVSPTGAASYSIPINLPPGTNNLAPNLSLIYDHRNGDSLIGMGFAISGLSAIARCNKTLAQDGVMQEPTLATADSYCLDGNRLQLTSGAQGGAASTYQTEIEIFARITAVGAVGGGPASWEVRKSDGLIYQYGATADSFIQTVGSSTARVWALNRVSDRAGNYIAFSYTEDTSNGAYRPNDILYTGSSGGASPATKVLFVYESANRPDPLYAYRYGSSAVDGKIHEFKRLDRIDIVNNATSGVIRAVDLSYESAGGAGGRSRLASVQECVAGDCLAATTFQWISGTPGWSSEANTAVAMPGSALVMDINSDGRDDVVYASSATSGGGAWLYMLGTDSGFGSAVSTGIANWNSASARAIEWNGDTMGDILYPCSGNSNWCVLQSTGSGFTGPIDTGAALNGDSSITQAVDINGDGRHDLVRLVTGALPHRLGLRLRNGSGFDAEVPAWTPATNEMRMTFGIAPGGMSAGGTHIRRRDYNGDGREDFALRLEERSGEPGVPNINWQYIFYGQGSTISDGGTYSTGNQAGVPGDFNGDGLTDLAHLVTGGCAIRFGRGYGLSAAVAGPACVGLPVVADYDGDGLSDLLMNNGTNWMVSRSTGNGFTAFTSTGLPAVSGESVRIADVNNDGLHDLVRIDSASSSQWKYRLHAGDYPDFLDRVTDGFGVFTDFNYQRLSSSDGCYARDPSIPTPYGVPYSGAMYVVCGISASDGIGGSYGVSYSYYSANYDYAGRGFLGFARKYTHDSRDNIRVVEDFRQDFPFIGMLKETKSLQPNGVTVIARATSDYLHHPYSYNGIPRYHPYVRTQTVYNYEVGGTYNGLLLRSSVKTDTVDLDTGAITLSTTTVTEGSNVNGLNANAGLTFTYSTSVPTLFNDFTNWCFGRPAEMLQTNSHQLNGGAQIQRKSSLTWDGAMCRPTQTVNEPLSSQWQVTTVYGYDNFGNVNSISVQPVSGGGQGNRTTTLDWGTTGRFPVSITNPKLQTTSFTWDSALGVRTSARDPNLLDTVWAHDGFGRLERMTRPDSTATDYELSWCNAEPCRGGDGNLRTEVVEIERAINNDEIARRNHKFDMFDRSTWTQSQVVSGIFSTQRIYHDARGLVRQVTMPYMGVDPIRYTTTTYDLMRRPTLIQRPEHDGDLGDSHLTRFSYQGLRMIATNARGYTTQEVRNAIGEIVQMIDQGGADTDYEYDAFGNLLKTIDYYSNSTVLTYNNIGLKLTSNDPDMGAWQYSYYPLGELKTQTDAKGNVTTFTYDELSRPLTRVEPLETAATPTGTTTFAYDAGNMGIGKLTSASSPAMSGATFGYSESYSFDNYGRPSGVAIAADNVTYNYNYSYNSAGLQDTLTYPTSSAGFRFKLRYSYEYGLLKAINNYTGDVLGNTLWQTQGMNARGQVLLEDYGSGLSTSTVYDGVTGKIESRATGPSAGTSIQNLSYQWDKNGNLTQRQDLRTAVTETFTYDALDRLHESTRNSSPALAMGYDAIGNITSKPGVGTYAYHATKKHAVVSTTGAINNSFGYDANGNMTTRNGHTTSWYSNNLPHTINGSNMTARFWYGPTGSRWKQQKSLGTKVETWTYIGPYLERLVTTTVNEFRHYVYAPTGPVLVYKRNNSGTASITTYLTTDHLGSTDVLTSSIGGQLVNASFNTWGERKGADGISAPTAADDTTYGNTTLRGFTFHEVLEDLKLVHMNGRVYDPSIGRFLSADPFVQAPFFSQSLNRYSYVFNNPLSLTDPSGFQSAADGGGSYTGGTWIGFVGAVFNLYEPRPNIREQRELGGFHPEYCQPSIGQGRACWGNRSTPTPRGPLPDPNTGSDEPYKWPVRSDNVVPAMAADQLTTVSTGGGSGGASLRPMGWRAEFFGYNPIGRAIAAPANLAASFGTWIYGGAHVNPLSGLELSPREQQDAEVLTLASGPIGMLRSTVARGTTLVIGRGADLARPGALRAGERILQWDTKLPDFKAEWAENAGRLREAMRVGNPIRDASPGNTGGLFLNAERNLLRDRGWRFDPETNYWMPPGM